MKRLIVNTDGKDKIFERYEHSINKVLNTVPDDDADNIIRNVVVFLIGGNYGSYYNLEDNLKPYSYYNSVIKEIKHIIIFNIIQMELEGIKWRGREHIIAHEFAHFICGHRTSLTRKEQKVLGEDHEKEADELAKKWGFPPIKK